MEPSASAPLIVQSLVIIAGSMLVIGALIGACVVAWRESRMEGRADMDSTRRYDRARRSLARLHR